MPGRARQVVPAACVRASTRAQVAAGSRLAPGYGYQWWTTAEQGHRGFAAVGLGGQLVEVLPDLDLVVVTTSKVGTAQDVRTGGHHHHHGDHAILCGVRRAWWMTM